MFVRQPFRRSFLKVLTNGSFNRYSTIKMNPKEKLLRDEAQKLEETYNNSSFGSLERVLINKPTPEDLNFKLDDPLKIREWVNKVAKSGPQFMSLSNVEKLDPIIVTVTGAAGSIAYSLLPRLLSGEVFGEKQPITLKLLDLPNAMKALEGTVMELKDLAFPLCNKIVATSDDKEAFTGSDYVFLVGAKPRTKGMERKDLLADNGKIFARQGKSINDYADPDVLTLVVGNPANTNALIASSNAPDLPKQSFTAMTRLDHDRGLSLIAQKVGCQINDIHRFCIWGNHSATQYPDINLCTIGVNSRWARGIIKDDDWCDNTFIKSVQQRGAEIINVMGKSSAASAANAAINHMRDWANGYNEWVSMAVHCYGEYGVNKDIWMSFPTQCFGAGKYGIIKDLPIDERGAKLINASVNELLAEKQMVQSLIPNPIRRFVSIDKNQVLTKEHLLGSAAKRLDS